jgi:hypothetical protein
MPAEQTVAQAKSELEREGINPKDVVKAVQSRKRRTTTNTVNKSGKRRRTTITTIKDGKRKGKQQHKKIDAQNLVQTFFKK